MGNATSLPAMLLLRKWAGFLKSPPAASEISEILPQDELLTAAHDKLLNATKQIYPRLSAKEVPLARTWDEVPALLSVLWGRRSAWARQPLPRAPEFPAAHQPALASEHEQYAVLCCTHLQTSGPVCVAFLLEIASTAEAPPRSFAGVLNEPPRLLSIACSVHTPGGESAPLQVAEFHPFSGLPNSEAPGFSSSVMPDGSVAFQRTTEGATKKSTTFFVSADGLFLQVAVRFPEADASLYLSLRSAAPPDASALMLDVDEGLDAAGTYGRAGGVIGTVMGGVGQSYTWPCLQVDKERSWIETGGRRVSLGGGPPEDSGFACAWHTQSQSRNNALPPLTNATLLLAQPSQDACVKLWAPGRLFAGGSGTRVVAGTARAAHLFGREEGGGATTTRMETRGVAGKVRLAGDEHVLLLPDSSIRLREQPQRGRIIGLHQEYDVVACRVLNERGGMGAAGWALALMASDFTDTLATRLRAMRVSAPVSLARTSLARRRRPLMFSTRCSLRLHQKEGLTFLTVTLVTLLGVSAYLAKGAAQRALLLICALTAALLGSCACGLTDASLAF